MLEGNELVQQVLQRCGYLPIAIAIIASLNLNSDDDWQNIIEAIMKPNSFFKTKDSNRSNLFKMFELSTKQLSPETARLFRLLGVFDAVQIPLQSVASLWKIPKLDARFILIDLNKQSLLTYKDGNRYDYILHR